MHERTKKCNAKACGKLYEKKKNISWEMWESRKFCCRECSNIARRRPPKSYKYSRHRAKQNKLYGKELSDEEYNQILGHPTVNHL